MERKVHSGCHGDREEADKWSLRVERMAFRVNTRLRGPETLARPQLGVGVRLDVGWDFRPIYVGRAAP
jgi:hypothetical protein